MDVAITLHAAAALLLIWAGVMKLAVPHPAAYLMGGLGLPSRAWGARLVGCAELAVGCFAIAVGGPLAVVAVSAAYVLFAVVVLRAMVVGVPSCGCFGQGESPPSWVHFVGNLLLAGVSLATVGAGRSPADMVAGMATDHHPVAAGFLLLIVGVLAGQFFLIFTALPEAIHAGSGARDGSGRARSRAGPLRGSAIGDRRAPVSRALVKRVSRLVERHSSRRGFLRSLAMSATAVAVAPAYIVRPVSAQSAIISCLGLKCHWKLPCCDGWTAFCCALTGENVCPPGTVVGGWWKVDDSEFCSIDKPRPRYYIDCNLACHGEHRCGRRGLCPSSATSADCRCPEGCESQRVDCVAFRYGQCSQDVCVGPIRCRVVTCVPPWRWDPACSPAPVLTNEDTRYQDWPCLHDGFTDVPPKAFYASAIEWMSDRGIATGLTEDLFGPDEPIRLGQLATLLWSYAGEPEPASSTDVEDAPTDSQFERAMAWMVEEKIETGRTAGEFDPSVRVSRAKTITYLHRLAGRPPAAPYTELFPETLDEAWYSDALDWASSYEIVWWSPPLGFEPNRTATRAEAAVFLYRLHLSHEPAGWPLDSQPAGVET